MRAVIFPNKDEFAIEEVSDPVAGPDHIVVHVMSTTICATDYKIFHGTVPHVTFPHIPGHEWGGEVIDVGSNVKGLAKGNLVGIEAHIGCNHCTRCAEGLYNLCRNYGNLDAGHAHIGFTVPGGLAEYCAVPARAAHIMPPELSSDHAAFTDTVGIVLWAFERAGGVRGGESVAVIGPGALGLIAVQIARISGAGRVIAIGLEQDSWRLSLARSMGADDIVLVTTNTDPVQVVRELTGGAGADLVIEFAGSAEAGRQSLEMARRGGRVVLGGATSPGKRLDVDLSVIVRGHLDVYGSVANPRSISERANILMKSGLVDINPLTTHHMPLNDFGRAWELFGKPDGDAIRIMLHP
jgi:L-iditol 2-dehydrogenase